MKKHTSKQVQRILATSLAALFLTLNLASCGQQANKNQLKTPAKTSVKTTQKTTVKTTAKTTEKTTATSQKATETKKTEAKKTEKKTEAKKAEVKKTQSKQAEDTYEVWTPAEEEKPVRVQAPAPARTQAPKPVQTEAPAPPPTEAPAPPPTEAPKPAPTEAPKIPDWAVQVRGYWIQRDWVEGRELFFAEDYGGSMEAAEAACDARGEELNMESLLTGDPRPLHYGTLVDIYGKVLGWSLGFLD